MVVEGGLFKMSQNAVISDHTINGTLGKGGGVYIYTEEFTKTGGIIYGNEGTNKNTATEGNLNGHAVFFTDGSIDRYRDTTLGQSNGLTTTDLTTGWNQ